MSRHINGCCSVRKNMGSHLPRQQANRRRGSQDCNCFTYRFGYRGHMWKIIGRRKRDRPFFSLSTERENGRGTSWKRNSNRNLKPHSTDPSLLLTPPSRQPSLTEWDLVSNKETAVLRRQRSEKGEFGIKRIDRVQITTRLALRQIEWRRANAPSNSFIF